MHVSKPGKPNPYQARVRRGGGKVSLGYFATAEEAALCIARSPEGQAAAKQAASAPVPLTSEEARQQAQAEGLTLLKADNKAGYFGVNLNSPGKPNPYQVRVRRGGKQVSLGYFATAEEAALCVARSPEGQAAAKRPVAVAPLTREEARQQAQAEGLTLLKADSKTGYFGVHFSKPGHFKPYETQVTRGGKQVSLGCFATAEEAALCIARSPEGQAAARKAASVAPLTSEQVGRRGVRSLRRKELPGRKEQVLTAPGARSAEEEAEVGVEEEAEEEAEEEEAEMELVEAAGAEEEAAGAEEAEERDVVVLDATVVEEEAEEAEDVQTAVGETVGVVQVMEHEDVVDEGGRLEGRTKRRRNT